MRSDYRHETNGPDPTIHTLWTGKNRRVTLVLGRDNINVHYERRDEKRDVVDTGFTKIPWPYAERSTIEVGRRIPRSRKPRILVEDLQELRPNYLNMGELLGLIDHGINKEHL